jgi:hypothetical protein
VLIGMICAIQEESTRMAIPDLINGCKMSEFGPVEHEVRVWGVKLFTATIGVFSYYKCEKEIMFFKLYHGVKRDKLISILVGIINQKNVEKKNKYIELIEMFDRREAYLTDKSFFEKTGFKYTDELSWEFENGTIFINYNNNIIGSLKEFTNQDFVFFTNIIKEHGYKKHRT